MADLPPLNVRVNVDASGVNAGVAQATAGLQKISDKAKVTTSSLSKFKTMALGVFGGNILTAGIFGMTSALTEFRNEVLQTQLETSRLETIIGNLGNVTQAQRSAMEENFAAFAGLGFGDAETVGAMGTLLGATNDVTQATKLMAMSADFARYRHIDLGSAAKILARGTQGSVKVFKDLGISLDESLPKNKAIAKAFDELNAKIGGTAQKSTETLAVKWLIFKEQLEAFGVAISKYVLPVFTFLVDKLSALAGWVSANQTPLMVLAGIVTTLVVATKGWAIAQSILNALLFANPIGLWVITVGLLAAAFVKAWNSFETFREAMAGGLAMIVGLIGYVIGGFAKMARLLSNVPGLGFLKGVADAADKAAISVGKAAKEVENLKNKKITAPKIPNIAGSVKPGEPTGIKGNVLGKDTTGRGGATTVQYITVYASNTNDIAKKLSKAAKTGQPIGGK
jgi:hypothetical protein